MADIQEQTGEGTLYDPGDIDLAPAVDTEGREHAFRGVGTFGRRIM